MNYQFLNNFLTKNFTKYFPRTINRKLLRNFRVFFVPTNLTILPKNFYPIFTKLDEQISIFRSYNSNQKLLKFNTKSNMDIFLQNIFKKKNFSYLDVGGDNIDLYLKLNSKLNIKNYYIFNFKEIIDIFKFIKKKFLIKNLYPITNLSRIKKIDMVYFGSSIQYFKDYKFFLKKIFLRSPKYIFFSGTTFYKDNHNEKLIVKQTNILPHTVYLYFFNLNKFINFFKQNGYEIVFYKNNNSAKINYKNFYTLIKNVRYLDVLFKKSK